MTVVLVFAAGFYAGLLTFALAAAADYGLLADDEGARVMRDPLMIPVFAVKFTFPDGSIFERAWTMDSCPPRETFKSPPDWLDNPRRAWTHPQDPVTLSGDVKLGREEDARAAIALLSDEEAA